MINSKSEVTFWSLLLFGDFAELHCLAPLFGATVWPVKNKTLFFTAKLQLCAIAARDVIGLTGSLALHGMRRRDLEKMSYIALQMYCPWHMTIY